MVRFRHASREALLLVSALSFFLLGAGPAQSADYAQVTRPAQGEVLRGVVIVEGTADHPAFVSYDLAFAYDPDPTDTWFSLGEPVDRAVQSGRLGIWDTTRITDGNYRLRLRVWYAGDRSLTVLVQGLQVRNSTPAETTTPAPQAALPPTASPLATFEAVQPRPGAASVPPDPVRRAFLAGSVFSAGGLGLLGLYSAMRGPLRRRLGSLRMRRLYRRRGRRRGRGQP